MDTTSIEINIKNNYKRWLTCTPDPKKDYFELYFLGIKEITALLFLKFHLLEFLMIYCLSKNKDGNTEKRNTSQPLYKNNIHIDKI